MSAGIEIYDSKGQLIFDLSSPSLYYIGEFTTSGESGTYTNENIVVGKTFTIPSAQVSSERIYTTQGMCYLTTTISNGEITWSHVYTTEGTGYHPSHRNQCTFKVWGVRK